MKQWDTARLLWTGMAEAFNYTKANTPAGDAEMNELMHDISNKFQVLLCKVDEKAKGGQDDHA